MTVKLTNWFDAFEQKPKRAGWYEVRCKNGMFGAPHSPGERLYFRRGGWFLDADSRPTETCSFGRPCCQWRGLSTPNVF